MINDVGLAQLFHVVLNIFPVGSYNRAVIMVARPLDFLALVRDAGIEDVLYTLGEEPHNMPVCKFGRVALGFARYGFNAKFIDFPCRERREQDTVAKFGK